MMNHSDSPQTPDRIDSLAARLLDAHLSETEQVELLTGLHGDPSNQDQFVEQVMLHALLRKELGGYRPSTLIESLYGPSSEVEKPIAEGKLPWGIMPGWGLGMLVGGAVSFVVFLILGGLWWSLSPRAPALVPEMVAAEGAKRLPSGGDSPLPKISALRVKSGTSMLTLDKIGTVVLEGQADFSLLTPMKARLTRGSIKMRVTEASGRGFEIETPYGTVRDLGTEFCLNIPASGQAGLVVFDGSVDFKASHPNRPTQDASNEHLVQGEGMTVDRQGRMGRIMSIITGTVDTFQRSNEPSSKGPSPVIIDVADNLRDSETKKYYEIVPRGLKEDALAYVDRPGHEWNGRTKAGMPSYLRGADYVKTFIGDRVQNNIEIQVTLSRPAKLYVFYDRRLPTPEWLRKGFRSNRDLIGMDIGPFPESRPGDRRVVRGKGPGNRVDDIFVVWERIVTKPGVVKLGPNEPNKSASDVSAMYGIAAKALNATPVKSSRATAATPK